jgi:hypothetical protein
MNKRLLALLLGSTALATTITFDPLLANPSQDDSSLRVQARVAAVSAPSDLDAFVKQAQLTAQKSAAHKPLVIVNKTGKHMNPDLKEAHKSSITMNDLSYMIAKRQSSSDKLNRLAQLLNANETEYAEYQSSLTTEYGLDCFDGLFAELAEFDHADRQAHLKRKIGQTEKAVQEYLTAEKKYYAKLAQEGWELKVFEGKTGYKSTMGDEREFVDDDRGFVAFHPGKNIIEAFFHGSRNWDDWKTNFDGQIVSAKDIGVDLPAETRLHRGFALQAQSAKANVDKAILEMIAKAKGLGLNTDDTTLIISGHSLGAAVATVYEYMAVTDLAKQIWGADYKNAERNNVKGIIFSAPRALSEESAQKFEEEVGPDNTYRQNVEHDPVPNSSLRKLSEKFISWLERGDKLSWLRKIPLVGNKLADAIDGQIKEFLAMPQFKEFVDNDLRTAVQKFSGYGSVGHLGLDDTTEAVKRMMLPALKAYGQRLATNLVDVGTNFWNWVTGNKAYNPNVSLFSFLKDAVVEGATVFAAPLHYGSTIKDKGGAFDPNVVGTDVDAMLKKGDAHVKAKAAAASAPVAEKPGFFSRVKSFFGFGRK